MTTDHFGLRSIFGALGDETDTVSAPSSYKKSDAKNKGTRETAFQQWQARRK